MPVSSYPWLVARQPIIYDALHLFVHPDGYRLSDRVWRANARIRNNIDRLLAYHVRNGTAAVEVASELERFLKREVRGRTLKPYGRWGSYEARRLARTEITAAFGRATVAAAQANPYVQQIEWALSPSRTQDWDCNCQSNTAGSPYPKGQVPTYPDHPHCMCTLRPVVGDTKEITEDIRAWLAGEESQQNYGGLFDLAGLAFQLLSLWGMRE